MYLFTVSDTLFIRLNKPFMSFYQRPDIPHWILLHINIWSRDTGFWLGSRVLKAGVWRARVKKKNKRISALFSQIYKIFQTSWFYHWSLFHEPSMTHHEPTSRCIFNKTKSHNFLPFQGTYIPRKETCVLVYTYILFILFIYYDPTQSQQFLLNKYIISSTFQAPTSPARKRASRKPSAPPSSSPTKPSNCARAKNASTAKAMHVSLVRSGWWRRLGHICRVPMRRWWSWSMPMCWQKRWR